MTLYSIKDSKSQSFGGVFAFPSDGIACRAFASYAKRDETMSSYPEDFDIYQLGVFSQDTGVIVSHVSFVAHLEGVLQDAKKDA